MIAISCSGKVAAGSPTGLFRSPPKPCVRMIGATSTISSRRVAWISDRARTSPPASCPKSTISCSPPGIDAYQAVGRSKPQRRRKNGSPTRAVIARDTGTSDSDSAICGRRSATSGVIDAPMATPRMVRVTLPSLPVPLIGTRASAATRQATSGPKRNGRGASMKTKSTVPSRAMTTVRPWRCQAASGRRDPNATAPYQYRAAGFRSLLRRLPRSSVR